MIKVTSVCLSTLLSSSLLYAATDQDIQALKDDLEQTKLEYEARLLELEGQVNGAGKTPANTSGQEARQSERGAMRSVRNNTFNPSIGVILNGQYVNQSAEESEIAGFAVGHEGESDPEGFSLAHTEVNFTANVDDKFSGSTTIAIAEHEGETELELEEAYVQTLAGVGLSDGLTLKFGRAFWTLGYLNEHHAHTDDFSDRPLPYRVFLDGVFNDDGVELSYVLPVPLYSEIGGGVFRGDDFPFGEADGEGVGAWSLYARVGGDIANDQSWRLGVSLLSGAADGERTSNEDAVTFSGDVDLFITDVRYTFAPTGNPRQQEVTLQAEYFRRDENGIYDDTDVGTGPVEIDEHASGWYVQGVYKFLPQWRVGLRYAALSAADVPGGLIGSALDADGHDPESYTAMLDWTNSEFSRVRLQVGREYLADDEHNNLVALQYIMSFGAHGAHKY